MTKKTDSPEFTAAAAALDKNSVALSEAIGSIYGKAAGDAFLPLWRKHIGFFVDYTVGKLTNDTVKATKAKADLDGYRADFGAFLASANRPPRHAETSSPPPPPAAAAATFPARTNPSHPRNRPARPPSQSPRRTGGSASPDAAGTASAHLSTPSGPCA